VLTVKKENEGDLAGLQKEMERRDNELMELAEKSAVSRKDAHRPAHARTHAS